MAVFSSPFSLRYRILLLVLLTIIPALMLILYMANQQREAAEDQAQANILGLVHLAAANEEQAISETHTLLQVIARLPEVQAHDAAACHALAASLVRQNPIYASVGVAAPDGRVWCNHSTLHPTTNISDRGYFQEAIEQNGFSTGQFAIGRSSHLPSLHFGFPVYDNHGNFKGVAFAGLDLHWLSQVIARTRLTPGATTLVIDRNGTVLASWPAALYHPGSRAPDALLRQAQMRKAGVSRTMDGTGNARINGFIWLNDQNNLPALYIQVSVPARMAYANALHAFHISMLLMLLVAAVSLLLAWVVSDRWILRGTGALLRATQKIANGDLSARAQVPSHSGEISELAHHFNGMAATLERQEQERIPTQQRLHTMAHYDSLTGLPNRVLFAERLEHAMAHAQRHRERLAVMFLDLDRFKQINDTLGHHIGDQLLLATALRLAGQIRKEDTVARMGGDEFTFILESIHDIEDAAHVARKILDVMPAPFTLEGHEVFTTPSIGISIFPDDAQDIHGLLRNADTAMYYAKGEGRNSYRFFNAEMNARFHERLLIENRLRRALERRELELYYQPQADMQTGRLIGAEALLRWHPEDRHLIPPSQFIPIAEETGLILPIGEWALYTACRQAKEWQQAGYAAGYMAINLSARQFRQPDLVDTIRRILADTRLAPTTLHIEITEGLIMENFDQVIPMLEELRALGIRISIDDFGTGYSSLNYLKRFPIDALKIDRTFVEDIQSDPDDAAIILAIIALSHGMEMKVIAEGVETAAQWQFLRNHGCDYLQGFLYSKPLPADRFLHKLKTQQFNLPAVAAGPAAE